METRTAESGYLEQVTAHFIEKRGRGTFVSPADLALLLEWERAGVPASAIAGGIDRTLEAFGEVRSVRGCRRFIVEEVERLGARVIPSASTSTDELRPALEAVLFSLDDLAQRFPEARDAFIRASARVNGVIEMLTKGEFDSPATLVEELALIEDGLADDLTKLILPEELNELKKRIENEMAPYLEKMDRTRFKATLEATVRASILRRFNARGILEI
jgi:hypothetical protein